MPISLNASKFFLACKDEFTLKSIIAKCPFFC